MKGQQKSADADGQITIMAEGAVATAEDPSAIAAIQSAAMLSSDNQPIKYLFQTEGPGGQVTYRVIQVTDGQLANFPTVTTPATQAVFTQSEGLEAEGTETHYSYYPATIADTTAAGIASTVQASDALLGQAKPTGQVYVMMSPQEVLTAANQRTIAPRTEPYYAEPEAPRTSRDKKRRAQHNEVERRRRDKINNWMVQLSKTIPDCNVDYTKAGQSKGGILSKACDYIKELRQSNHKLGDDLGVLESHRTDNQLLRQEVEDLKSKNQILRNLLVQNSIVAETSAAPQ